QIPVDGIAKRLIDANAVNIDGETFRSADQRRGGKAVVVDVELKGVIRAIADVNPHESLTQIVRDVIDLRVPQILAGGRLHIGRDLVQRKSEAGEGCVADD